MNKKCPNCNLINFIDAEQCRRCEADLKKIESSQIIAADKKTNVFSKILWRAVICLIVCLFTIAAFYLSLIFTSAPLKYDDKAKVNQAIKVLKEKGFSNEAFLLSYVTSFRSNDHWLNASVEKENAYAATNYPFEIMTLYPDFFSIPIDDTERAAVLLHEAAHLQGKDEKTAYIFVWKNREKLGWTKEKYLYSIMWRNVRKQTKDIAPELFVCDVNEFGDCTETQ